MARRRTPLDALVDAYLALDPTERPYAMAALRGADRALKTKMPDEATQERFEEIGATLAGESNGG